MKELINNTDYIYQSIKNKNFKNRTEVTSFFDQFFENNKKNPDSKILEVLDFLLNNENPFPNISDTTFRNILLYNKMRYLYYAGTKNESEYHNLLLNIEKDSFMYVRALILIGIHYTKFSHLGKAFKIYSEANELLSNFKNTPALYKMKVTVYANLAYVYYDAGLYDKTEDYFTKATKYLSKNNTYNYLVYCMYIAKARKNSGKISPSEYLKELYEIDEKNTQKNISLSKIITTEKSTYHIENKDYKVAHQIIMEYLKDKPLTEEPIIINLLICLYNLKRYEEYEELYKKEIEKLIDFAKLKPEHKIIEYAIDLAQKKKDEKWEIECLRHQVNFDIMFYNSSKLFLLEMAQNEYELKSNEKKLNYERLKTKTQIKYNQALINKNKELEHFASIVAHDIKSPLQSMTSLLDILESSLTLDKQELKIFNLIKNSSRKLTIFIDDLVNYAKYGKSVNKYYFVDLNKVFAEIQFILKDSIVKNKVIINIKSKLPQLYAYKSACTQLFLNLINNSIKFRKPDCLPQIDIWHETDSEKVRIYLKDNGVGIQKEELSDIFQPFKRGSAATKTDGIGIGLATCQKIINNIEATITVDSIVNEGSTFKIEIAKKLTAIG